VAGLADSLPKLFVDVVNDLIRGTIKPRRITYSAPATLTLVDAELFDDRGARVAVVERAVVDVAVTPLFAGNIVIKRLDIEAPTLDLKIRDGELNLIEALKTKKKGKGGDRPDIDVKISNITVDRGRFSLDSEGKLHIQARGLGGRADVRVDVKSGSVLVTAQDVRTSGGRVDLEKMSFPVQRLDVKALTVTKDRVKIEGGRGRALGAPLTARGTVSWKKNAGRIDLRGHVDAPAGTWPERLEPLPFPVPSASADVTISGPFKKVVVDADGSFGATRPYDYPLDGGTAKVRITPDLVRIERALARRGEARVRASGSYRIADKHLTLDTRFERAPLSWALSSAKLEGPVRGVVAGTARIVGVADGEAPLAIDVNGVARNVLYADVRPPSPLNVSAELTVTKERVTLKSAHASGRGLDARADGTIALQAKRLDLGVSLNTDSPLRFLQADMPDELVVPGARFGGKVRGPYDDVRVIGDVRVPQGEAWGVPLKDVRARLNAGKRRVQLDDVTAVVADGQLEGVFALLLSGRKGDPPLLESTFVLEGATLERIRLPEGDPLPVTGTATLRGELSGTTKAPVVEVALDAQNLVSGGETLGDANARLTITKDRLVAHRLTTSGPIGEVRSGSPVSLRFEDQRIAGSVVVHARDLGQIEAAKKAVLQGSARGRLSLGGTIWSPAISGPISLKDLNVKGVPLGSGPALVRFVGEPETTREAPARALQASVRLQGPRGLVEGRAAYALERERVHADLRLVEIDLEPWLETLPESVPRAAGLATGRLKVRGPIDRLDADLSLHASEITLPEVEPRRSADDGDDDDASVRVRAMRAVHARGPLEVRARLRDGKVNATVCAFASADSWAPSPCGGGERVWAVASGVIAQDLSSYDLDLRVSLDEDTVERFVPALREQGVAASVAAGGGARVVLTEGQEQPVVTAELQLKRAHIELDGAPPADLVGVTRLSIANNVVTFLDPLRLSVGGSEVVVAGRAGAGDVDLSIDGTIAIALAKLYTTEISSASGSVDAHVTVTSRGDTIVPSGTIVPSPGAAVTLRSLRQRVELVGGKLRFDTLDDDGGGGFSIQVEELDVRSGDGRASLDGRVDLAREGDDDNARWAVGGWNVLARGNRVRVKAGRAVVESAFDLELISEEAGPVLRGQVEVTDGLLRERFELKNFVLSAGRNAPDQPLHETLRPVGLEDLRFDVDIALRDFRVRADIVTFPLEAELVGNLKLISSVRVPGLAGAVSIVEGSLQFPKARFELSDSQIEFPRERASLEPQLDIRAQSLLSSRVTRCENDVNVELSLKGDNLDDVKMELLAIDSEQAHSRFELLANAMTGYPLPLCQRAFDLDPNMAVRALTGELTGAITSDFETLVSSYIGGELQLGVFAESGRVGTDVRWQLGRRAVFEGETPLASWENSDLTGSEGSGSSSNLKLRLLLADHLPGGGEIFVEGGVRSDDDESDFVDAPVFETLLKYRLLRFGLPPLRLFGWAQGGPPPTPPPLPMPGGDVVTVIDVAVARADEDENAQLERFLDDLLGRKADEETARAAERRLVGLGRYKSAVCRIGPHAGNLRLKCGVARARTIRAVFVEGLPPTLLETDLRKRLFLRPGEALLKQGVGGRDRVSRQRKRVEQYLEREGFYGAKVEVRTPPVSRTADVDVVVRITGGSFVAVREVKIDGALPFSTADLRWRFGYMCAQTDGLLSAYETLRWRCFTEARLSDTVERLEAELRERGFPEGRVLVRDELVDPGSTDDAECGVDDVKRAELKQKRLKVPPRCVDLNVRVLPGPRVVPSVALHRADGKVLRPGPHDEGVALADWAGRKVRDILEVVARPFHLALDLPLRKAPDTDVGTYELLEQLTFAESGSADETEARLGATAMERYLASRGWPTARVEITRSETEDRVDVHYAVHLDEPAAIASVRFVGNESVPSAELNSELEIALEPRSGRAGGFLDRGTLDDDVLRILQFYEDRGWREAEVTPILTRRGDALHVTFRIDEGTRYRIGGLRLRGGDPGLAPLVLAALVHCQRGVAAEAGRPPIAPADCNDAPFLDDELEAEGQRVRNVYARAGYPYARARVALEPDWLPEGPILGVTVWDARTPEEIAPTGDQPVPPPVRASRGEIFIEGNFLTDRAAMLKDMSLREAPQKRLDPVKVSQGVSRLRQSGLFSRVSYDYVGKDESNDELHLRVRVEERVPASVDTALRFTTQDLGLVRLQWNDRNLGGMMLDVGATLGLGLFIGRTSDASLRFRYPRVLGSDFDFALKPSVDYSDRPSFATPRKPAGPGGQPAVASWFAATRWRRFSTGTKASVDWKSPADLVPGLSAGVDYDFSLVWNNPNANRFPLLDPIEVFGVEARVPSAKAMSTLDGLTEAFTVPVTPFGILAPHVRYGAIQNPFDPVGGWSGELALNLGSPLFGNNQNVLLLTGRATSYWAIADDWVLALNVRAWGGYAFLEDNDTDSILLRPELLNLGGDRTVRGYAADRPFGLTALADEVSQGARKEDLFLAGTVANLEARWTVVRNLFLGDLQLAVFSDVGFVTDDARLPTVSKTLPIPDPGATLASWIERDLVGVAFGAGVRYVLPVGPMSFDIAYAPVAGSYAPHFQLGYSF
jgi:outer membrane protein assembly factor BamA/autotransporter translocation and assembly factor TamB